MKSLFLGMVLILTFAVPLWGQAPALKPDQGVSLVFSSNIQGEVEPCG